MNFPTNLQFVHEVPSCALLNTCGFKDDLTKAFGVGAIRDGCLILDILETTNPGIMHWNVIFLLAYSTPKLSVRLSMYAWKENIYLLSLWWLKKKKKKKLERK